MHLLGSAGWFVLGACWLQALLFNANRVGGVQFIAHMNQTLPATLNVLMAVLCFLAGYCILRKKNLPIPLVWTIVILAILHMINVLPTPIGYYIPTNTMFTEMIPGYTSLFLLPIASLLLLPITAIPRVKVSAGAETPPPPAA